ncbi:BRCA1 associated protein-like [Planoprotostelium fungivorum]|uniref:BRCA1 associated protein-like n=1 Tax=Planoprotostelium fungivorum TaxID=1890364 RepID=A0A2P6NWH8_9EUKA|nr:BRCA1 associated protein-like [Planoprotostelium fungivorum]
MSVRDGPRPRRNTIHEVPSELKHSLVYDDVEDGDDEFDEEMKRQLANGTIEFVSGNPAVELSEGVIYSLKEKFVDTKLSPDSRHSNLPSKRGLICCVLGVPSFSTPSDFARFTGPHIRNISHMRVLRHTKTDKTYMVVLRFFTREGADSFYNDLNNKQFVSMEPEVCTVLFVSSIVFSKPAGSTFPETSQEQPLCPVCLERFEESSSGVLTVLCHHTFHSGCLSKWKGGDSCPVCRFSQQPEGQAPVCFNCSNNSSLWICIICGNVGCGRYLNSHAREHYNETKHRYALELSTSRTWDYEDDTYVHRLATNKSDGGLVVIEGTETSQGENTEDKVESLSLEYSYAMESQCKYFEEQMYRLKVEKENKIDLLKQEVEGVVRANGEKGKHLHWMKEEKKRLDKNTKALEVKMRDKLKEVKKLYGWVGLMMGQMEELKSLNNIMKHTQQQLRSKITKEMEDMQVIEKKIREVESQNELLIQKCS